MMAMHGNVAKPDYGTMEDHCAALLELDGHDVRVACDGPSAVEAALAFSPSRP